MYVSYTFITHAIMYNCFRFPHILHTCIHVVGKGEILEGEIKSGGHSRAPTLCLKPYSVFQS